MENYTSDVFDGSNRKEWFNLVYLESAVFRSIHTRGKPINSRNDHLMRVIAHNSASSLIQFVIS